MTEANLASMALYKNLNEIPRIDSDGNLISVSEKFAISGASSLVDKFVSGNKVLNFLLKSGAASAALNEMLTISLKFIRSEDGEITDIDVFNGNTYLGKVGNNYLDSLPSVVGEYGLSVLLSNAMTSVVKTAIERGILAEGFLALGLNIVGTFALIGTASIAFSYLEGFTTDLVKKAVNNGLGLSTVDMQFTDKSGVHDSGLFFEDGMGDLSDKGAVAYFLANSGESNVDFGTFDFVVTGGFDRSYKLYDAAVYQVVSARLGITLDEFLDVGEGGAKNGDNYIYNFAKILLRHEDGVFDNNSKIYIPVVVNGVTQVIAVESIFYNGGVAAGKSLFGIDDNPYVLYLSNDANVSMVIRKYQNYEYDDIIIGSSGSNDINYNTEGNDTIIAMGGDDKINAGYGSNIIDGGEGSDTVDYSFLEFGSRDIEINLETHTATNGFATSRVRDSLYNIENIIGSKGDDDISGDASNNTFYGNDGYDNLSGGAGDDKLYGNADEDILDGGSGNDNLFGGSGNDSLKGGFNNDNLYGNDGNDILDGESGNDILLGGAGLDTYNFSSAFGVDTVNDSDRSGKILINGNWVTGDASLVDDGSGEGGGGGGSTSTNNIHQLSVNGVTYYLKMSSGVLLIAESQESLESVSANVVKIQGFVNGQFGIKLEEPEDPEFGADPVTDGWRDTRTTGPYRIDPLTLDLDGDGVELVSLENSNTFFDLDADGLRENVGWISSDDGILVYDSNNSGSVDNINELFGDNDALGTVELAQYDDNADGVIDSNDAIFSKLQVWQDYDQDGISDEGELKSLSDHNVTSINVNPSNLVNLNQEVAGNVVLSKSTYNYTVDGVTHTNGIYNLELAIDQTNSIFEPYVDEWGNVVDYEINPETLLLPQSRGYGELHAWNVAMSENADLFAKMQEIVALSGGL